MENKSRYTVLKNKEIREALTRTERNWLECICETIRVRREKKGKQALECVVVESDWPEYEPTLEAIEKRVRRTAAPDDNPYATANEVATLRAIAAEYDRLIRHMDAGGDFHEFQRDQILGEAV